jgi:D-erythronate 2-dehydrogenase
MVADYTRKGFIDGRSLRLPTIVVRPGKPNKAASTFASSIIREPLAGQEAICPVGMDTEMFVLSPRGVVEAILHTVDVSSEALGVERTVQLPGLTVSVREMLATLEEVAGARVRERVRFEPDAHIQRIVAGWARRVAAPRAERLGYHADASFADIVRAHIDDELHGTVA